MWHEFDLTRGTFYRISCDTDPKRHLAEWPNFHVKRYVGRQWHIAPLKNKFSDSNNQISLQILYCKSLNFYQKIIIKKAEHGQLQVGLLSLKPVPGFDTGSTSGPIPVLVTSNVPETAVSLVAIMSCICASHPQSKRLRLVHVFNRTYLSISGLLCPSANIIIARRNATVRDRFPSMDTIPGGLWYAMKMFQEQVRNVVVNPLKPPKTEYCNYYWKEMESSFDNRKTKKFNI